MSDHVDGPGYDAAIFDPDLSDLFAFTSPEDANLTGACRRLFPSAGVPGRCCQWVNHSIVVRHISVAGLGNAAKFTPGDREYRALAPPLQL